MKLSVIIIMMCIASTSLSQPTPEWTSPIYDAVSGGGWLVLQEDPLDVRFFIEDSVQVQIMDGAESSNVAVSIIKTAGEFLFLPLCFDVTGDAKNDLYFLHSQGFRIVNSVNGETYCIFDDPSYFYWMEQAFGTYGILTPDIDDDGSVELLVGRCQIGTSSQQYLCFSTNGILSAIYRPSSSSSAAFSLAQNYPNPFNPNTKIEYNILRPGAAKIDIFQISGRLVRSLNLENQMPGMHQVTWDGTDNSGARVSSGVYFYVLQVNGNNSTKKMIILR